MTNPINGKVHRRRTSYTYDANGRLSLLTVSDIGGSAQPDLTRTTTIEYNENNIEFKRTDAAGGVVIREFDARNNLSAVIDQLGRRTEFEYNASNALSRATVKAYVPWPGGPARDIVTFSATSFDQTGTRPTSTTDAKGRLRVLNYWADGQLRQVTLKNYIDASGVAADLVENQFAYDFDGNLSQASPGGVSVDMPFDTAGRPQGRTVDQVGLNRSELIAYDGSGRGASLSISQANIPGRTEQVRTTYDAVGRRQQTIVENGATDLTTQYGYNNRNLLTTVTDPKGNVTTTTYDVYGRVATVSSPVVNAVTFASQTPTPGAPKVEYGYNTFGEVESQRDELSRTTAFTLDKLGRPLRWCTRPM